LSLIRELQYFGNSLSLLIVEDEKSLNSELSSMLSLLFSNVYSAHNGIEGLENYKINKPDIVLTDITMPKMDGIEMSQEIKNLNREQSILVLSAHGDTNYMIELIDIGIDQFILKPFDKNTLLYKLLKVSENIIYKKEFDKFYKEKQKKRIDYLTTSKIEDTTNCVLVEKNDVTENVAIVSEEKEKITGLSHDIKNANTFMNDLEGDDLLWITFKNDIPELMHLSEEFTEDVDRIELDGLTVELRDSIVSTINSYVRIFSTLDQMLKMTEVLGILGNFLDELDVESLTDEQQKHLKILEYINNDITRFLQTVFVYKDNVDIYYLEDSLESSINQLKNDVLGIVVEEEDVDFF